MEGMLEGMMEPYKEQIAKMMEDFTVSHEKFTARDGVEVAFEVIKHKSLESTSAPAYIYAHGGGGWACKAKHVTHDMAGTAKNLNCIVFNIDYRLAPEAACPKGQEDFVDAINHIMANGDKFGIDTNKVCMAGCSGGGWIAVGAANLLAKADDLGKIKALFVHTGQLSNSAQDLPEDQWEFYEKPKGTCPP